MRRVLVLRPEPGASATAEKARERALDAVAMPLFQVEPLPWKAPETSSFDALLLTSANSVRSGGEQLMSLRGLPVYAVGEATAEAAREKGFDIRSTGDSGADRLLGSIAPDIRLLHLCGDHKKAPEAVRQAITSIPVYRSDVIPNVDLGDVRDTVALIHSARAGRRFAELVEHRSDTAIAAISAAAAEGVGGGWAAFEAAEAPNDDALLALAARLCNKSGGE